MPKNGNNGLNNLKASIDTRIDTLKSAEASVKVELGHISRELLLYVPASNDIGAVNRLLKVLSGSARAGNQRMAVLYFRNFLPWAYDDKAHMFTVKIKGDTKIAKKMTAIDEWLKDDNANIWTWADRNIETREREKNYASQITSLVKRALEDEKYAINPRVVVSAIITGGVSLDDIMSLVTDAQEIAKLEAEKAKANTANENDDITEGEVEEEAERPALTA